MKKRNNIICKSVQKNAPFYIDNEITSGKREEIEEHLGACELCRNFFLTFQETYELIDKDRIIKTNPFLFTKIMAKIEARKESLIYNVFNIKPAKIALVILLPLIAGIWLGSSIINNEQRKKEEISIIAETNNLLSTPGYASFDYYDYYYIED